MFVSYRTRLLLQRSPSTAVKTMTSAQRLYQSLLLSHNERCTATRSGFQRPSPPPPPPRQPQLYLQRCFSIDTGDTNNDHQKTSDGGGNTHATSPTPPQQSATLYHEWYRPPALLTTEENDHSTGTSSTAGAKQRHGRRSSTCIVFLHGLLGNVRNIKTMAKKLCDSQNVPGLLLDLTGHGRSSIHSTVGSVTFDRVCDDIERTLQEQLSSSSSSSFTFVGHSLGGRLALHYAHNPARRPRPTSLWLLDTVPGQPDESVLAVLEAAYLVSQRHTWRSRYELTTALSHESYQLPMSICEWLAAQYDIQHQRFNFDLRAAESLADDFGSQDFWQQIDKLLLLMMKEKKMDQQQQRNNTDKSTRQSSSSTTAPAATTTTMLQSIHLVQGGRNKAWEPVVPAIQERVAQNQGLFVHHVLPDAGHWVHVDDLPGLVRAFETTAKTTAS